MGNTDDAHRHDGNSEFLREIEHSFLEFVHEPVARARSFRERDQADIGVKSGLRALRHDLEALAGGRVRYSHVAEPAHDPPVDWQFEMRLELEAADELRTRGVDYEWVENIHMVADEDACPRRVEARRPAHFELHRRQPHDVAKKSPVDPVVLAAIQRQAGEHDDEPAQEKVDPGNRPKHGRTDRQPRFPHTITSSAAGRTSAERISSRSTSPSTIRFT